MSKITFETAAVSDAIKKAAQIAPSKGSAFDKAAGIVIEFNPNQPVQMAVIRATNLEIFYIEWVDVVSWEGESARWRLSSFLLAQIINSLPIGSDKTVTLEEVKSGYSFHVVLTSGRTKAKLYPMDEEHYPQWAAFDPDHMFPATDLGGRVEQVQWAAAVPGQGPKLSGVYLDGEFAIATDSYRLACVPLSIPDLVSPIVVPSGLLSQALKQTGEISIGISKNMLHIMPNEYTQIKTVIYDVEYPNVSKVIGIEFTDSLKIKRDELLEIMTRVNAFSIGDRTAAFRCFIGKEEFAVYMSNEQMGEIGDVVEIPGFATHERFEVRFTPKNIMEGLQKAPNNDIELFYHAGNPKTLIHIDGGSGYRAWIVPRVQLKKEDLKK